MHLDKPWLEVDHTPDWEKRKIEEEKLREQYFRGFAKEGDSNIDEWINTPLSGSELPEDWEDFFNAAADAVNHPPHYKNHPSGVECIEITEHMNFCLGNAVKYIWRAGLKGDALEDLKKAEFYIKREIERIEKELRIKGGICG